MLVPEDFWREWFFFVPFNDPWALLSSQGCPCNDSILLLLDFVFNNFNNSLPNYFNSLYLHLIQ